MLADWDLPENRKRLGRRLHELREQNDSTQLEFSIKAGCGKNYISALERGVNKLTVRMLLEYCQATHLTPNKILEYDDGQKLNSELLDILNSFTKEQYERAIIILKALQ